MTMPGLPQPGPPPGTILPQPVPLSWRWEQVPGQVRRTPDASPEAVMLVRLTIHHPAGAFVGHFLPDDLDKLADQGKVEAGKSRVGIETYTQIPETIRRPGSGPNGTGG
jgi:hypothetical protein